MTDTAFQQKVLQEFGFIRTKLTEHDQRFDKIETDISELRQDVESLKDEIKIVKQDVETLKQEVKILRRDVYQLKIGQGQIVESLIDFRDRFLIVKDQVVANTNLLVDHDNHLGRIKEVLIY